MNPRYEVRIAYYGGLACTSDQIRMIRENIAMDQHYREQDDNHELFMHYLRLNKPIFPWFQMSWLLAVILFILELIHYGDLHKW